MRRWPYTFAVCLSIVVGTAAIFASHKYDVPMRDPDGFLGPAYIRLPLIVLAFFAVGIIPQAIYRAGFRGAYPELRKILREEWTFARVGYIVAGLMSFYICYVSYRNLKSDLPLARDGVRYDKQMLEIDYHVMFGHYPGPLLHDLLGTGIAAQVLSVVYVAYLPLIPLTLGAFLVWSRDVRFGAWYATALSLNWVLGVVSYYIVPTLGPVFQQQSMFENLPDTSAAALQHSLAFTAIRFRDDPAGHTYGIAGFASLHVSVVVSACLFLQFTHQRQIIRIIGWSYLVLVVLATVYFGWHYLADDVAGAFIGWVAVVVGGVATGNTKRQRARRAAEGQDAPPAPLAAEPAV